MPKYEFGSKITVLKCLFEYAIRDRESLIDAINGNGQELDSESKKAIEETEKLIRDFVKLRKTMLKGDK